MLMSANSDLLFLVFANPQNVKNSCRMKNSKRPPTEEMIRKLRKCLEREEMDNQPFLAEEMKSSMPGLYKRGLIVTKMQIVGSKRLLCIYVSHEGKEFLKQLGPEEM